MMALRSVTAIRTRGAYQLEQGYVIHVVMATTEETNGGEVVRDLQAANQDISEPHSVVCVLLLAGNVH